MSAPVVVDIDPCGALHFLVSRKTEALLREGRAVVQRISEIVFEPGDALWTVVFARGPFAGRALTSSDLAQLGLYVWDSKSSNDCLGFTEYARAVEVEVEVVTQAQLRGETWMQPDAA